MFGQALDGRHQDVVVAQKIMQDELGKGIAEARVLVRV